MSHPIHSHACVQCPSAHYMKHGVPEEDCETQDLLEANKATRAAHAFVCAWRTEKVCRGYCDHMGLAEDDLDEREPLPPEPLVVRSGRV